MQSITQIINNSNEFFLLTASSETNEHTRTAVHTYTDNVCVWTAVVWTASLILIMNECEYIILVATGSRRFDAAIAELSALAADTFLIRQSRDIIYQNRQVQTHTHTQACVVKCCRQQPRV